MTIYAAEALDAFRSISTQGGQVTLRRKAPSEGESYAPLTDTESVSEPDEEQTAYALVLPPSSNPVQTFERQALSGTRVHSTVSKALIAGLRSPPSTYLTWIPRDGDVLVLPDGSETLIQGLPKVLAPDGDYSAPILVEVTVHR